MSIKIVTWSPQKKSGTVLSFLGRSAFDLMAERAARRALAAIRKDGDRAVAAYTRRYDRVSLRPREFRVDSSEIAEARAAVDAEFRSAVREARKRIIGFAKKGIKRSWTMPSPKGGLLGEQFMPLDRVGVYVPGGAAPLVSTALMTVTLAQVAGVREIVACTPAGEDGKLNPCLLYALDASGATEIYRIGGIQAIGMMAYGTKTVKKVQKIVGPGGAFVTAAKRQVYGYVALDMPAGPSEIAVLADAGADPRHVAADLLSQAEHGTGCEKALLVTPSPALARDVRVELRVQAAKLRRREAVRKVMKQGMLLVVVASLDEGMELCNRFAPEHLELMVRNPKRWLKKVRKAGAVFLGTWSPESAGDFVAGPSHVLPTGGAAAMFSGLAADDFRKKTSIIAFSRADLGDTLPVIETFARVEGLDAHAVSARIRFEKK